MEFVDFFQQTLGQVYIFELVDYVVFGAEPCPSASEVDHLCLSISIQLLKRLSFLMLMKKHPVQPDSRQHSSKTHRQLLVQVHAMQSTSFFKNVHMMRQMNHTLISLIPKCSNQPFTTE